jgi:hypothetical protein
MKRILRTMQTFSKEGIMVNKSQRGMNTRRGISPRRPSTSRNQRSFNHCEGNNIREGCDKLRHEFKRTASQRGSLAPRYQSFLCGYCFTCNNFGHKFVDCRAYGRNVQARDVYVTPYNIECYKLHN